MRVGVWPAVVAWLVVRVWLAAVVLLVAQVWLAVVAWLAVWVLPAAVVAVGLAAQDATVRAELVESAVVWAGSATALACSVV